MNVADRSVAQAVWGAFPYPGQLLGYTDELADRMAVFLGNNKTILLGHFGELYSFIPDTEYVRPREYTYDLGKTAVYRHGSKYALTVFLPDIFSLMWGGSRVFRCRRDPANMNSWLSVFCDVEATARTGLVVVKSSFSRYKTPLEKPGEHPQVKARGRSRTYTYIQKKAATLLVPTKAKAESEINIARYYIPDQISLIADFARPCGFIARSEDGTHNIRCVIDHGLSYRGNKSEHIIIRRAPDWFRDGDRAFAHTKEAAGDQ